MKNTKFSLLVLLLLLPSVMMAQLQEVVILSRHNIRTSLSAGFMPFANIDINHRYIASKIDPVFTPR